jgi:hypothetical protein
MSMQSSRPTPNPGSGTQPPHTAFLDHDMHRTHLATRPPHAPHATRAGTSPTRGFARCCCATSPGRWMRGEAKSRRCRSTTPRWPRSADSASSSSAVVRACALGACHWCVSCGRVRCADVGGQVTRAWARIWWRWTALRA